MTYDLISLVFKIQYPNWDGGDEMHGVISLISACFDFVVSLGEWGKVGKELLQKQILRIFVNAPGQFWHMFLLTYS